MVFIGRVFLFGICFLFAFFALFIALTEHRDRIDEIQEKGSISGLLIRDDIRTPLEFGVKRTEYVPGEIIIKVREGVEVGDYSNSIQGFLVSKKIDAVQSEEILPDVYRLRVGTNKNIDELAQEYQNDPDILFAEPNYRYYVDLAPNDSSYSQQWSHQNSGAEFAWNLTRGNKSIVIAVIDTGIDWDHPDLAFNVWNNTDEVSGNGIDDDSNGFIDDVRGYDFVETDSSCWAGEDCGTEDNDPMDFHGHGTHVSGIAAAVSNNSVGVSGVCWSCKIMPVRAGFALNTGQGVLESDDIAQAINYAVNNNASIISMSFGGSSSSTIQEAIDNAYSSGVVLVASAGNSNSQSKQYPAGWDNVLAVGAHDSNSSRASFSQYGSWVDISGPGVSVYSTTVDDNYVNSSGTSMSAPYVSGVIGLVLSLYPEFSPLEVYSIARSAREDISSSYYIGTGRINSSKAVSYNSTLILNISSDHNDIALSDENLSIVGSVSGNLINWTLSYGSGVYPSVWTIISSNNSLVDNSSLGVIDSRYLLDGDIVLRLSGYDESLNFNEDRVRAGVENLYPNPLFRLYSPSIGTLTANESVGFLGSVFANESLSNVSLFGNWNNWSRIQTNESSLSHVNYSFSLDLSNFTGTFVWALEACYSGLCSFSENSTFTRSNMALDILYPSNSSVNPNGSVVFGWNVTVASGDFGFCNLSIDGSVVQENISSSVGEVVNVNFSGILEGVHDWGIQCSDESQNSVNSSSYTFFVDTTPPSTVLFGPDNSTTNISTVSFNFSVTDSVDSSLDCNLTVNSANISVLAINGSATVANVSGVGEGANLWNVSCVDDALHTNISSTLSFIIDSIPPSVIINSPLNGTNVTSPDLVIPFNLSFSEEVLSASYEFNGSNESLCSSCSSALVNVSLLSFGVQSIQIYVTDSAGNSNSSGISFVLVLDTDGDGIPDYSEADADNDGILDSEDGLIGSESNLASNFGFLMLRVNGIGNTSKVFDGELPVEILLGNDTVVSFDFNFTSQKLTAGEVIVKKFNSSSRGQLLVRGLSLPESLTKSVYLDRVNTQNNFSSVCIKDSQIASISEISLGCNSSDETLINCPGSVGDYSCTAFNSSDNMSQWKISGLNHSGIIQSCSEDWSCSSWSTCSSGSQSRVCVDLNSCGTTVYKPSEIQSCAGSSSGGSSGGGGGGSSSKTIVEINGSNETYIEEEIEDNVTQKVEEEVDEEIILIPVHNEIPFDTDMVEEENVETDQNVFGLLMAVLLVFGVFVVGNFRARLIRMPKGRHGYEKVRRDVLK